MDAEGRSGVRGGGKFPSVVMSLIRCCRPPTHLRRSQSGSSQERRGPISGRPNPPRTNDGAAPCRCCTRFATLERLFRIQSLGYFWKGIKRRICSPLVTIIILSITRGRGRSANDGEKKGAIKPTLIRAQSRQDICNRTHLQRNMGRGRENGKKGR